MCLANFMSPNKTRPNEKFQFQYFQLKYVHRCRGLPLHFYNCWWYRFCWETMLGRVDWAPLLSETCIRSYQQSDLHVYHSSCHTSLGSIVNVVPSMFDREYFLSFSEPRTRNTVCKVKWSRNASIIKKTWFSKKKVFYLYKMREDFVYYLPTFSGLIHEGEAGSGQSTSDKLIFKK